jgi:hypothetical protein
MTLFLLGGSFAQCPRYEEAACRGTGITLASV